MPTLPYLSLANAGKWGTSSPQLLPARYIVGAYSECELSSQKALCKIDCIYRKAQIPPLRIQAVGFAIIKFLS